MTDSGDRYLNIIVRYATDQSTLSGATTGAKGLQTQLKGVETQAASTMARLQQLRAVSRELSQIGTATLAAGTALTAPFIAAAAKYMAFVGQTEAASRQWSASMTTIEQSVVRVGRLGAATINPWLQKAADISAKIAGYFEQNPGLIEAALKVGAAGVVLGVLEKAVAEGVRLYADVQLIAASATQATAAGLMNVAADKMLAAATGSAAGAAASGAATGGAVVGGGALGSGALATLIASGGLALGAAGLGGLGVGALGYDQIARRVGGTNIGQFASVGAYGLGKLLGGDQLGAQWFTAIAKLTQATDANTTARLDAANSGNAAAFVAAAASNGDITRRSSAAMAGADYRARYAKSFAAAIPLYQQYQSAQNTAQLSYIQTRTGAVDDFTKQTIEAQAAYNQTRVREVRDFNEQEKQIEKSYDENRLKQVRDFNESQAKAQLAFDESQAKAAEAHGTDMQRLAQDFADQQKQAVDQHNQSLHDLAAAGDALGFVKEQQNFAKQQADAKTNYDKEVTRRNADYAQQQADAKAAFAEQRAQQQADFKQQQDDAKQAYDEQRQQRDAQQTQRLADMDNDFKDQQAKAAQQQQDRLDTLDKNYQDEKTKRTTNFTDQLNQLDAALTGQVRAQADAYAATSTALGNFLKAMVGQVTGGAPYTAPLKPGDPGYDPSKDPFKHWGSATGGYVGYGWRMLGEQGKEFVLNHDTTVAAERMLGGLTQDRLMAGLLGGGGVSGGRGGFNFSTGDIVLQGLTRDEIRREAHQVVDDTLTEAFNALNGMIG